MKQASIRVSIQLQNVHFQGGSHLPIFPSLHIPWEQGHPRNQHRPHCWGELCQKPTCSSDDQWSCLKQVWMDDYKRLFYMHRPDLLNSDIGSVTNRLKFKQVRYENIRYSKILIKKYFLKDLQCKPFSWFLKNIYPEKFILDDPKHVFAYGRLKNPTSNTCLDNLQVSVCFNFCSTDLFDLVLILPFQNDDKDSYDLGQYACHNFMASAQFFSFSKK